MSIHRPITLGLFGVMVVAFFLPWVAVSCSGQKVLDISGFQIATAGLSDEPGKVSVQTSLGETAEMPQGLQIAAIAAIGSAVLGVFALAVGYNKRKGKGMGNLVFGRAAVASAMVVIVALVSFIAVMSLDLKKLILPFMAVTDESYGATVWLDIGFIMMLASAVIAFFYARYCNSHSPSRGDIPIPEEDRKEDGRQKIE